MKKFLESSFVCIVLFACTLSFAACGNSSDPLYKYKGYTAVQSVTINTGVSSFTYDSTYECATTELHKVTLDEFAELKYIEDYPHSMIASLNFNEDGSTRLQIGEMIKFRDLLSYAQITGINKNYVYVKTFGDNKIEVIKGDSPKSLFYAESYRIEYFKF